MCVNFIQMKRTAPDRETSERAKEIVRIRYKEVKIASAENYVICKLKVTDGN